jgi:hypothetical protein
MRQAIPIAVTACLVMSGARAAAQSSDLMLSGNALLAACTRTDHEWIGFCNGYLQAAFDTTGGQGVCAPDGVTRNDLFDAVIPRLQSSSDLQSLNAVVAVATILRDVYRCR